MILLFGNTKSSSTRKNTNIKNHPVENSGILANRTPMRSLLAPTEYDMYMFSKQAEIDYSMYSENNSMATAAGTWFMSDFSEAYTALNDGMGFSECGFSDTSFGGGDCCSCCSCGSFSSLG